MDIRQYLKLIIRRLPIIIASGLILAILTMIHTAFFADTSHKSTLFFTVSSNKYGVSLYDDIRGADLFSESVQGWTKNPSFIAKIEERTNETFEISGRVQETENVIIEMSASTKEAIIKVSEETLSLLNEKITEFNNQTSHSFKLAIPSIKYSTRVPTHGKNEILALLIGFILGIGLAFLYEYLTDKASFIHQVEEILGEQIAGEGQRTLKKLKGTPIKLGKTSLKELRYIKANSKTKIYPVLV